VLVYTFLPEDGTIGYPVPRVSGVPGTGGEVRWPDAAGLASGKIYRSVLHVQDGTVGRSPSRAPGTVSVRVPAAP